MPTSETVTRGVRVQVESTYLPERSNPRDEQWFFSYRIRITNEGTDRVQLLSRHWIIMDANGEAQEVHGPGVVGQQPVIPPGSTFEYTSFCPLGTSFGTMHGTYEMTAGTDVHFEIEVAPFTLCEPHGLN